MADLGPSSSSLSLCFASGSHVSVREKVRVKSLQEIRGFRKIVSYKFSTFFVTDLPLLLSTIECWSLTCFDINRFLLDVDIFPKFHGALQSRLTNKVLFHG